MAFFVTHVLLECTILVSLCESKANVFGDVTSAFEKADNDLTDELSAMRNTIGTLSRQLMLQQFAVEERVRSDGDSGVKQVRLSRGGTKNYHSDSHSSYSRILAIHEHANNIRTVGMGEFIAVLNGIEFRTRHNDYRLYMSSRNSSDYHATDPIPLPEVPPEVANKSSVDEEIAEMREWFKAWRFQNYTVRDYRKYFKPVLCYLEGAWTKATSDIDEPFESDRHFIDASSWFDLQEKIRFTSYTGGKDNLENFSYLPTTIMNIINETIPEFAQWNYRILCHPVSRDIPLNRFRVVDELHTRLPARRSYDDQANSRAARFQLNPSDDDEWKDKVNSAKWTLLDDLMSEIPGKDNYRGNLTDGAFGLAALTVDPEKSGQPLNAAYYHRWYKVLRKDAMGQSYRHRGFADQNLFMAMTTQPKVAEMTYKTCKGNWRNRVCTDVEQKFSYAIPLEIIWLTPLNKWNPFDLEYKGPENEAWGKSVFSGGRYGGRTVDKAYNGTNSKKYYLTPSAFFTGGEVSADAADTTRNSVGVLDKNGTLRITRASGIRIILPLIDKVGVLRQRYPIVPVHGEGSSVWKELEALKDIVLKSQTYGYMYREPLGGSGSVSPEPPKRPLTLKMEYALATPPGAHSHDIELTPIEEELAKEGVSYTKLTSSQAGHQHNITVIWNSKIAKWEIAHCDDEDRWKYKCKDKHGKYLIVDPSA